MMTPVTKTITQPAKRGRTAYISLGDLILAGQENATLHNTTQTVSITNKIDGVFQEVLSTEKSWRINCSGLIIKDSESYQKLEQSYFDSSLVDIIIDEPERKLVGKAYITSFPISLDFDDAATYNVTFTGSGKLEQVDKE